MEDFLTCQFKSDPERVYKIVFDELYKPLCSFAKKYILDLDEAEDIIQNLFLRLWEQRDIDFKTSIKSYLFQSARNECLNYIKHRLVEDKYKDHLLKVYSDAFYESAMEEEEINKIIYDAIQNLPSRCRQIFELSRIEEKSIDEISKKLSLSTSTVKNQLVTALKRIRSDLEKYEILIITIIITIILYLH